MKKIISFIYFLLPVLAFSQGQVILQGEAIGSTGDSVEVKNDRYYLGKKVATYASLTKDSKFLLALPLDHDRIVSLKFKGNTSYLYLEPTTTLTLKIGENGTIEFEGSGAINNTFLQQFNSQFNADFDPSVQEKKILEQNIDVFEIDLFDAKQKQNRFYADYKDKKSLSEGFINYLQKRINYNYWSWLLAYPALRANASKAQLVNPIPAIMLESLDKSKVVDSLAMICDSYRYFLNNFIIYFNSEANGFKTFHDINTSVSRKCTFAKNKLSGEPYSYFVCKLLLDFCEKMTPSYAKIAFTNFETLDKKGVYSEIAKQKCGDWMSKKDPKIEPLPSAGVSPNSTASLSNSPKFKNSKGKEISLDDLKGKVLYVDFWASWCGPCRQQFPFSQELHKKLTDKQKKQIEFVYISIDDDEMRWKKGIEDNKLDNGLQLLSPGGWKSDACKYFQINSIPRYMIIDKKGVIKNCNAPRPSDDSILDELLELIK